MIDAPPFAPHPLAAGFHAQTIAAAFWPRRARALGRVRSEARRLRVTASDEVLALCHWQPRREERTTLLLVHGLTGSATSAYMRGTAEKGCAAGFNVVRLNLRNCGGTSGLCSTLYNGGLSGDVRAACAALQASDGLASFVLAGFSLGGNIVLRVAGEAGASPPAWLAGVVAVSAALDLATCATRIDTMEQLGAYRRLFLDGLKRTLLERARLDPRRYDVRELSAIRTLRAFDDRYTGPDFGFRDAAEYYAQVSALPLLAAIGVPALLISARDDALVPAEIIERPEVLAAPRVERLLTDRGGHCAFLGAAPAACDGGRDADRFWAENRVVQFACSVASPPGEQAR